MNHLNPNRTTDPESLVECPYDRTHMIRVKRWPAHIIKCRKNHPTKDLRVCPFNARHEVPAVELRYHIAQCADQVLIHQEILYQRKKDDEFGESGLKGNTDVPPYDHQWNMPLMTEDWDAEYNRNPVTVDVMKDVSVSCIDRTGLTPSQRREYRKLLKTLMERERANEPADDIRAAIRELKMNSRRKVGDADGQDKVVSDGPRLPHGLPRAITQVHSNHVTDKSAPKTVMINGTAAANKSRLAANFNNNALSGLGRGFGRGAPAVSAASSPASNQVDMRVEILAKLARGRGVAKPAM